MFFISKFRHGEHIFEGAHVVLNDLNVNKRERISINIRMMNDTRGFCINEESAYVLILKEKCLCLFRYTQSNREFQR